MVVCLKTYYAFNINCMCEVYVLNRIVYKNLYFKSIVKCYAVYWNTSSEALLIVFSYVIPWSSR